MFIQVALRSPGSVRKQVKAQPFFLARTPATLRELIEELVRTSLASYMSREEREEPFSPLDDAQLTAMREVGKFAWLLPVETRSVAFSDARRVALQAFDDGLVRIFQNGRELTAPEEPLVFHEEDVFTLIRLTFLTGQMW